MPQERHPQSPDCWLESFSNSMNLLVPKFRLGDIVTSVYIDDETGETFSYRLQVVGLTVQIPGWFRVSGWWYFCKFLPGTLGHEYLVRVGAVEPFPESELEGESE